MNVLKSVAIACPEKYREQCIAFYCALGCSREEIDGGSTTKLFAFGYEGIEKEPFYIELITTPDYVTSKSDVENVQIDGPNKLIFYSRDIVSLIEYLKHLECGFSIINDPVSAGGNSIALLRCPCGVNVALVHLQSDRHYHSDGHKFSESQWEVRLGYVQLVCDHPHQTAQYLQGLFRGGEEDDDHQPFLRIVDEEEYSQTKFVWLSNEERDMSVSLCLKYTPNKTTTTKVEEDDEKIIKPGQILSLGIVTRMNMVSFRNEIKQKSTVLNAMLHLGSALRCIECTHEKPMYQLIEKNSPKSVLFEVTEKGGMASEPKMYIAVSEEIEKEGKE
jgi:hypothetical protein